MKSNLPPQLDLGLLIEEHTLQDVAIATEERASIYAQIDHQVHDLYGDDRREDEQRDVVHLRL